MNDSTLSVVIPVYNAARTLLPFLEECLAILPGSFADYEIILVDDASHDTTPSIVDNLAANYDPIMVIHHPHRRGYAASLKSGAMAARGEYVLVLDAGRWLHMNQIEHLLPYYGQYDSIIGYPVKRHLSWYQRFTGTLINNLLNLDLPAPGCYFTLVRTELLQQTTFRSRSALIWAEIHAHALHHGWTHIQVGMRNQRHARHAARTGTGYAQAALPSVQEIGNLWFHMQALNAQQQKRLLWIQRAFLTAVLFAAARSFWLFFRRRIQHRQ